jgi:hypothetical protein
MQALSSPPSSLLFSLLSCHPFALQEQLAQYSLFSLLMAA